MVRKKSLVVLIVRTECDFKFKIRQKKTGCEINKNNKKLLIFHWNEIDIDSKKIRVNQNR
jgi:hypothetical protein